MPIVVQCQGCKKKIKAAEKFAGKRVKCPGCKAVLTIPAAAGSAAAPAPAKPAPKPAAPAPQAPAAASLLDDEIPIRQESAPAQPAQPAAGSLSDLLDDDIPIRQEPSAQAAGQTPTTCPGCGTTVQAGAVLCVDCGYDFRAQGKRTQQIGEGKKKRRRGGALLGGHTTQIMQLLRGCLFSFIGACIGAFIWYIVARFTLTEWVLISWGLGGLAGAGMAVGYGHEEMLGGICAAVIAFVGIIIAKIAIFMWILGPIFALAMDISDEEFFDEEVVAGEESPGESAEEGIDDENVNAESAANDSGEASEIAEKDIPTEDESEIGSTAAAATLTVAMFFLCMFGFSDILFILLACGTAFKVGSMGTGG